jgi:phenylalanyl-tRNA synthetase beta chain
VIRQAIPSADVTLKTGSLAGFDEHASAAVLLNGEPIGEIGMIAQATQDYYDLARPIAAGSLRFAPLVEQVELTPTYTPLAKYPAIHRDLSVVVDEPVTWRELADVVDSVAQPLREKLDYVTTYRGKQIGKGKKSVTMRLAYRSDVGTLQHEQVDEEVNAVVAALKDKLNAELRAG